MICNNCGCTIDVPASFCPKCGADLARTVRRDRRMQRDLSTRQDVLATLSDLKRTFACQERNYYTAASAMDRLEAARHDRSHVLPAAGACVWAVACFLAAAGLTGFVGTAGAAFLVLVGLVPAAALVARAIDHSFATRRDRQAIARCCRSIAGHYQRVEDNPLPFEYCNPPTLDALSEIVRLDRADTLEEAVWTFEHERTMLESLGIKSKKFEESVKARRVADLAARLGAHAGDRPIAALR